MNTDKSEQDLLENINRKLNQSADDIDTETRTKLRKIRLQALAQSELKSSNKWSWLQPVPVVAAISFILVLSVTLQLMVNTVVRDSPALEDLPLLTANDDIELYSELEFYQWLDATDING